MVRFASYLLALALALAASGPPAAGAVVGTRATGEVIAPSDEGHSAPDDAPPSPPSPLAEEPEPQPEIEMDDLVSSGPILEGLPLLGDVLSPMWHEHLREQSGVPRVHERPPRR